MNVVYVITLLVYYQCMGMRLCIARLECALGMRLCVAGLEIQCILLLSIKSMKDNQVRF